MPLFRCREAVDVDRLGQQAPRRRFDHRSHGYVSVGIQRGSCRFELNAPTVGQGEGPIPLRLQGGVPTSPALAQPSRSPGVSSLAPGRWRLVDTWLEGRNLIRVNLEIEDPSDRGVVADLELDYRW
jgi:hypothetical protein